MTTREESIERLNQTHDFPQPVMVKAIGQNENEFETRVADAVCETLQLDNQPIYRTRLAKSGNHIAVTLEPVFQSAEEVLAVYEALRAIEGVVMLM
jgi:putative lipoic acid-binding regulatory protein